MKDSIQTMPWTVYVDGESTPCISFQEACAYVVQHVDMEKITRSIFDRVWIEPSDNKTVALDIYVIDRISRENGWIKQVIEEVA